MILLFLFQRIFALVSLAVLGGAGYLLWRWWDVNHDGLVANDGQDWRLYLGAGLLAWSLFGRLIVPLLFAKAGNDQQRTRPAEGVAFAEPAGGAIHVATYGPEHAPALIFTHGWGMDSTIWWEAKRVLSERFRVIVWDLPGLGKSKGPKDRRYSLERYAADLRLVLACAHGPAILVGHSIGGMITQTFCKLYPETLQQQVAGIVLENTSHMPAHRTTIIGPLLAVLRKPLLEPMLRLDIILSPLVWLMNWQSYLSGSTHLAMRLFGFGTQPTRAQLNQTALLATKGSPAVQAKGNLAMMHWDVTGALPGMQVPALVFIGDRDLVTVPSAGERIAAALPMAKAVHVPEAGHMGPVERWDTYDRAIAAFADEVFTAGAIPADAPRSAAFERPSDPDPSSREPGLNGSSAPPR